MKRPFIGPVVASLVITIVACGGTASDSDLVARVGDYALSVDEVVALLADEENLPTQADIIESLADLWIDYTLLADAAADDSSFSKLDLETLVRLQLQQTMISQLRDSVIQVDTFIAPDELRALYEAEAPDVELHARHIMLTLPVQATPAQRDSVRGILAGLRARIVAGERFEDIARAHSQDPGSSLNGGDLGFFARGDMVLPFEEAVLALEPGEVSDVVETPMGIHLIRLDERRVQDFDQVAPGFRVRVQAQRNAAAESTFVAALEDRSAPELADGAFEVARELARSPETRLSGGAARRPLVSWNGGEYSAGELRELFRFEQPALRDQVAQGTDEELQNFLLGLGRRDLLLAEARLSGLEPPRARVDSLVTDVRAQLLEATRSLGLLELDRAPGEARELAVSRVVRDALADNLSGATRVVPLGHVGFQLREGVPISIFPSGVGQSLLRIGQLRAARGPSPLEESVDTSGRATDTAAP